MIQWIVTSSILIAVIAALRFLLRGRISLRLQYALWALVLLRLLVPLSFGETGLSVGNLTQRAITTEAAQTLSAFTQIELPRMSYNAAYAEVAREYAERGVDIAEMPLEEYAETVDYEVLSRMSGGWSVRDILNAIWIFGIIAAGLALLVSNTLFAVKLRRSRRELAVGGCARPVYVSEIIDTPCLFGLFRPCIYLTPAVAENETILRHSVEHEYTHFRHGDHIWSLLRGACLALHWYNPLVWWAASLSRRDAELACDEATINRLGESERAEYGRTLIGLTCQKRPALLLTATTMTGGKRSIRERIMLIAKKPKMAIYTLAAVLLIAALAVGCTFTGAREDTLTLRIENAGMLWLRSGTDGTTLEITDPETIAYITDNITALTYSRGSSSDEHGGWSYWLQWYDEDGELIDSITVMSEYTIDYNGFFYSGMEADYEIDTTYLDGLLGDAANSLEPTGIGIDIAVATDELLSQLPSYDEIDASTDEYGNRLLLTATGALSDLDIFRLVWDEDAEALSEGELLYHAEELTQQTPLVLWVSFPGVLPTVGLSYIDAAGQVQAYFIVMSGEDGSILLSQASALGIGSGAETDANAPAITIETSGENERARLVTVDGISHMPLDELPREVLSSLTLASEGDFNGNYPSAWGYQRTYTASGLELITTAPSAAYLDMLTEREKDNRELFPTEADFRAYIEGEEGREWIVRAIITDDKYATLAGLRVGMTVVEAEGLGYILSEGVNRQFGDAAVELSVTVDNGTVIQLETWWAMSRYIGKFFEL
ncbi:MAG: M56 family metallopeptidase [Bacillota bacterium]|nr:M56 family metallopeptidase [Bacillota bacterium]